MCVSPACTRIFIGTPAAHSLSTLACVSQNSGHLRFRYSFGLDDDPHRNARRLLREQRVGDVVDRQAVDHEIDRRLSLSISETRRLLKPGPWPQTISGGSGLSASSRSVLRTVCAGFGYCVR